MLVYQLGTFANVRQGYVRDPSNKDYPMNPKVVSFFGYFWCCYSAAIPQTGFLALGLPVYPKSSPCYPNQLSYKEPAASI